MKQPPTTRQSWRSHATARATDVVAFRAFLDTHDWSDGLLRPNSCPPPSCHRNLKSETSGPMPSSSGRDVIRTSGIGSAVTFVSDSICQVELAAESAHRIVG